jgi:hypothetical protein
MTRSSARRTHVAEPVASGGAPTYQDVLDEALEETFPASDPIAPAVMNAGEPVSTGKNPIDWKLERSSASADRVPARGKGDADREALDDV